MAVAAEVGGGGGGRRRGAAAAGGRGRRESLSVSFSKECQHLHRDGGSFCYHRKIGAYGRLLTSFVNYRTWLQTSLLISCLFNSMTLEFWVRCCTVADV